MYDFSFGAEGSSNDDDGAVNVVGDTIQKEKRKKKKYKRLILFRKKEKERKRQNDAL